MDVENGVQDAGAAPVTESAETQGNQGETISGADTQNTATAEGQTDQATETTNQEPIEVTEGTPATKGAHQKTLEERVQELAEKRITEVETRLTAKFEEVTRAKTEEKPNFYEIDLVKVNDHIRSIMDQIEDMNLQGKYLEAMELQDGLNELRQSLRSNEQRKAEWAQRTQAQQQSERAIAQTNEAIVRASELVAKEHNISPEVWKAAEEYFIKERAEKPLLDAQYREKVFTQGPIATLLWAKEYVEKNMGKKEQEVIDKKEAAKTTLPPGKTSSGEISPNANLTALRSKAEASGNAEDLAAWMAEKSKAAAT